MQVKVCHNGDDVFIGWKTEGFISDCRGFALMRRRNTQPRRAARPALID